MATWPANGETDWNTKMLAYLAIGHNTDGTHKEVVNIRDYGAIGDDSTDDTTAIRAALTYAQANGLPLYFPPCSSRYKITDYLEITTDDTRIICSYNQSPIRQDTWGKPVFWVQADDVSIINPYMVSTETRDAIAGDLSGEGLGTLAAFNFSAGIFLSKTKVDKGDRLYVNHWYAEGFVYGIITLGLDGTSPLLDEYLGDGYVNTVDWGVFSRAFNNLRIDSLNSIDTDRSQAVAVHGIYTFGTQANPNKGLSIGQLTARNNYAGDHAFQIKYTEDIVVGSINCVDCSAVLIILGYCNGSIGPISAKVTDEGTAIIAVQTHSKIIINGVYLEGPWVVQGIAATDSSKLVVNGAYMVHTGGVALDSNVFYSTGGSTLEVNNPKIEFTTNPTDYVFDTSSDANTILRVFNPAITGIGAACKLITLVAGIDLANSVFSFDPKLISNALVTGSIVMAVDAGPYNVNFLGETATALVMETAEATPVVCYATYFTITNAGAQNVTDFTHAPLGHRFTIEASGDSNTTFVHAANQLETYDGANYALPDGKCIEFVERGGCFYETWRSP